LKLHTELAQKPCNFMCLCVCVAREEKTQRGMNPSFFPRNNNNNIIMIIIIRLLKDRIGSYDPKIGSYDPISCSGVRG
jgi:hypothetical protein